MKNFITPINVVRGQEPRCYVDLLGTTIKQIELTNKYHFKTTYLLQYDAFIKEEYQNLFLQENPLIEVGIWFELCAPLIKEVGLNWRGREGFDWDHYLDVDNLLGYEKEYRTKIIDAVFDKFKSIFGYYPKVLGTWVIDEDSLSYIVNKYHIVAYYTCREQLGTDGITLFGGYYNQGYYPSKNNLLCPSDVKNGIPVPTFRLLGCDPIYQYDFQLSNSNLDVCTLEPAKWPIGDNKYSQIGGHNKNWISWYFDNLFNLGFGISFNYAQVGQENSFGYERIYEGLIEQYDQIKELLKNKKVTVVHASELGEWFRNNFDDSPTCSQIALQDYEGKDIKSIWYYNKNYRINLFAKEKNLWFRDLHIFDENFLSRYKSNMVITENSINYDNVTIMNGLLWSDKNDIAGIYFCDDKLNKIVIDKLDYKEENKSGIINILTKDNNHISIQLNQDNVLIESSKPFALFYSYHQLDDEQKIQILDEHHVNFYKRDFKYSLNLDRGMIQDKYILSEENKIYLKI